MLEKKVYLSVSEINKNKNKNFANCKSLCNLQGFYTAFKEKHPNVNIDSQSSVSRDPNGVFLLAQK